jgi:hypothetical protein
MAGEDLAAYRELVELILTDIKPKTMSEALLAKEIADAHWELLRLKGFKAGMINAAVHDALQKADTFEWPKHLVSKDLAAMRRDFRDKPRSVVHSLFRKTLPTTKRRESC